MKRKATIAAISGVVLIAICVIAISLNSKENQPTHQTGPVISNLGKEYGYGYNSTAYDVVSSVQTGKPVFQNNEDAFNQLETDCKGGLDAIKSEFDLKEINRRNWEEYAIYSWQTKGSYSKEIEDQLSFIGAFFDIYENE